MTDQEGIQHSNAVTRAKISYVADIALGVATFTFLHIWVTAPTRYFSPYFLDHGFCDSTPQHFHTQRACAYLDWTVALITLIIVFVMTKHHSNNKTGDDHHHHLNSQLIGNGVIYPLVHGSAHWLVSTGRIDSKQKIIEPMHIVMLAVILSVGPVAVCCELQYKKVHNPLVLALVFLVLDIALTWFFVSNVEYNVLVLLYINVATNLLLFCTRVVLFNPFSFPGTTRNRTSIQQAVEYRNAVFGPKLFYQSIGTMVLVVLVMWVEPTQCGSMYPPRMGWFAMMGGHIWFDVSLSFMAAVYLLNALSLSNDKDEMVPSAFFY